MLQKRLENGRIVVIDNNNVELSRKEYVIREFCEKDRSRSDIARELEVSYQIIFSYTKDLRNNKTDERRERLSAKYEEFNKKHTK